MTSIKRQVAATRDGFGQGLVEAAAKNKQIVGLCADLTGSMRMTQFKEKYPKRFVQVGVAEQNLIGIAAGLAIGGKIPFAASFAAFSPSLSWKQIRLTITYSNLNVKIVGGHAGLTTGPDGATHQALEDIAMMRTLPNMTVVVPADSEQARLAVHAMAANNHPTYLRLSRQKLKNITSNHEFKLGKAQTLNDGQDVTIIACGDITHEALEAAELLKKKGLSARIINMHTIKPLDRNAIIDAANETKVVVTAEDHQITGGLGSAVAEVLAQEQGQQITQAVKFKRVGVKDEFGESGQAQELLAKYGLNAQAIARNVIDLVH